MGRDECIKIVPNHNERCLLCVACFEQARYHNACLVTRYDHRELTQKPPTPGGPITPGVRVYRYTS